MLFEMVTVASIGALIGGGVAFVRRRKGRMDQSGDATADWPVYERDRREYGEQMRVALMVSDARLLLARQYAGKPASRREMLKRGLPERRHKAAVLLLRTLHIYGQGGYMPTVSERLALQRLERHQRIHAARITRSPAAYVAP